MIQYVPSLLILCLLLAASAFFSGSETALFSLSLTQRNRLADDRSRTAKAIRKLLARPRLLLVTILTGNELVNVGIGIVVATLVARILSGHELDVAWVSLIATVIAFPVLVVFGEVSPKTLAAVRNEQWARAAAIPLTFFATLITPVRYALRFVANTVIRLTGGPLRLEDRAVTEAAYRRLVDEGRKDGVIAETEQTMIHNVFRFWDARLSEIMTPADEVFSLPLHWPLARLRAEVATRGFSRIPIMGGRPVRPVGIVYVKDLVAEGFGWQLPSSSGKPRRIRDLVRRPLWVPGHMKASELLTEFQRRRVHMGLVANEHGDFIGLVTMEDLLEELVGEIVDETDTASPPPGDPATANVDSDTGSEPPEGPATDRGLTPGAGLEGPWQAPAAPRDSP